MAEGAALRFGFSPCPNDTFILGALVQGLVPSPCPLEFVIEDVEALNQRALAGELEVSKLSFGVFGRLLDTYQLLPAGAALGFGCGPLLVARKEVDLATARVAIPGLHTTAYLLLRLYAPQVKEVVPLRYDQIMPAVSQGLVEAGLIIHESRFVYQDYGLKALVDLGAWWERCTKAPIPLGGIFVRRDLPEPLKAALTKAVSRSLAYAKKHRQKIWPFIKAHAQEMSDEVIEKHIRTYVNDFTEDLGREGRQAVRLLLEKAFHAGLIPSFGEDFCFEGEGA